MSTFSRRQVLHSHPILCGFDAPCFSFVDTRSDGILHYFVVCLFVLSITLQSARLSLGAICLRGTRPRRFCDIKRSCSRCHHKATTMMTAAVAAKRLLNRQSFTRARSCVTRLDLRWSSSATESTDYLSDRCNLNIVSR